MVASTRSSLKFRRPGKSRVRRAGLLASVILAVTVVASLLVPAASPAGSATAPPPAAAGTCTTIAGKQFCGKVTNSGNTSVTICNGWTKSIGGTCAGTKKQLKAGETSTKYFKDTDGYVVNNNTHVHNGAACYHEGTSIKITDLQHPKVRAHTGDVCHR